MRYVFICIDEVYNVWRLSYWGEGYIRYVLLFIIFDKWVGDIVFKSIRLILKEYRIY